MLSVRAIEQLSHRPTGHGYRAANLITVLKDLIEHRRHRANCLGCDEIPHRTDADLINQSVNKFLFMTPDVHPIYPCYLTITPTPTLGLGTTVKIRIRGFQLLSPSAAWLRMQAIIISTAANAAAESDLDQGICGNMIRSVRSLGVCLPRWFYRLTLGPMALHHSLDRQSAAFVESKELWISVESETPRSRMLKIA